MNRENSHIARLNQCIGNRIYLLRLAQGLSRQQLADAIDVTHQQLKKYEEGKNRLSAGRLVLIAKALSKEVSYFYKDIENRNDENIIVQHQRMCLEISRNFMKIKDPTHQTAISLLVRSLSKR